MKKVVCLAMFAVLLSVSLASAKVIFVGSHGGWVTYINYFGDGKYYDPLEKHESKSLNEISQLHGVDATIALFRANCSQNIISRVYDHTASVSGACDWIDANHESGDYVFLVGYSAGGKFVINLADQLEKKDIHVHFLGMIDPVVGFNISIPANVGISDVYIQREDDFDFQGSWFFFYYPLITDYNSYTVFGPGVDHETIDNQEIVWRNLGTHMLYITGVYYVKDEDDETSPNYEWPKVEVYDDIEAVEADPSETARDITKATDDQANIPGSGQLSDANISIQKATLGIEGEPDDSCQHKLQLTMAWGESKKLKARADVKNKGESEAINCDFDFRAENNRDFDKHDPKLGDKEGINIDPSETATVYLRGITVSISSDGTTAKICGPSDCRSYEIVDNFIKAYIFADVECEDDHDISSETDTDEYGKIEIIIKPFLNVNLQTSGFGFLQTPKYAGDQARLGGYVTNIGSETPNNNTRATYYVECPGTGLVNLTGDTTEGSELTPNTLVWEETLSAVTMPNVTGNCIAYFCSDTSNSIRETNENDNCSEISFALQTRPIPKITVTNPTPGEDWNSDKKHTIRWTSENLPYGEPITIQYSCTGGSSWRTIYDGNTTNDYSKGWYMYKDKTKDDRNARLRFIRRSDGSVISISHAFYIDHKKGTPSW